MTGLFIPDPADRDDLRTLLRRALRLDEAAVVRFTAANQGAVRAWIRTPFGALASRVVPGSCAAGDVVCGADHLLTALDVLPRGDATGELDTGYALASAWSGLLPPADGFRRVEAVPAQVLVDLAESGRGAARDGAGPLGVPPSLLDQVALTVAADTADPVAVEMRAVFALDGCGFVPTRSGRAPESELVHVSTRGPWTRLDARFGTIHRRPDSLALDVLG